MRSELLRRLWYFTVRAPWGILFARGEKKVENRKQGENVLREQRSLARAMRRWWAVVQGQRWWEGSLVTAGAHAVCRDAFAREKTAREVCVACRRPLNSFVIARWRVVQAAHIGPDEKMPDVPVAQRGVVALIRVFAVASSDDFIDTPHREWVLTGPKISHHWLVDEVIAIDPPVACTGAEGTRPLTKDSRDALLAHLLARGLMIAD